MKCTFCGARVPTGGPHALCEICQHTPIAQPDQASTSPMDAVVREVVRNVNAALNAVFGRVRR